MTKDKKKNKDCGSCASCNGDEACKIQQRIFEREVDEELQQEHLENLWKKYRFLVYGVVLAVIIGTAGFEVYKSWWQKTRLMESDRYETALVAAYSGKTDDAVLQLEDLTEDARTGYRYLAQIEAAGILLASGKTEEALSLLTNFVQDSSVPKQLREAVTLTLVGYQLEAGNAAELQALLTPLLNSENASYSASAAELSALVSIRENQPEQAVRVLEKASVAPGIPPQLKERLMQLLSEIKS